MVAQLSEDMIEAYMCLAEEADSAERTQPGNVSCYKCFKMFSSETELQEHQHEHFGKQLYQCRFCPENFNRSDLYRWDFIYYFFIKFWYLHLLGVIR